VTELVFHQFVVLVFRVYCTAVLISLLLFCCFYLLICICHLVSYCILCKISSVASALFISNHLLVAVITIISSQSLVWLCFVGDTTLPADQSYFLSVDDAKDLRYRDRKVRLPFERLPYSVA